MKRSMRKRAEQEREGGRRERGREMELHPTTKRPRIGMSTCAWHHRFIWRSVDHFQPRTDSNSLRSDEIAGRLFITFDALSFLHDFLIALDLAFSFGAATKKGNGKEIGKRQSINIGISSSFFLPPLSLPLSLSLSLSLSFSRHLEPNERERSGT